MSEKYFKKQPQTRSQIGFYVLTISTTIKNS